MSEYCPTCHRTHNTWIRLNDGLICGRCHVRKHTKHIQPLHRQTTSKPRILKLNPFPGPLAG
jgi:5-methylcytosine-specific restriction endonuclease McrA